MEDPNDTSSSHTESSAEGQQSDGATSSKDTHIPEDKVSINEFKTEAIEVNSADEVRQAIKVMLSGKTPHLQNEGNDPVPLATNTTSEEIQVSLAHEYKPESGDQLIVPTPNKTRKRQGRPQKAGPSKRMKTLTVDHFYVGKLSNVVPFPSYKRKRPHQSESDSDVSIFTPNVPNQWLRMRFYK